jgi:hypothetical protein
VKGRLDSRTVIRSVLKCRLAMTEIACGPMDEMFFADQIPFVCSLFQMVAADAVRIMYGWGCADEHLWEVFEVPTSDLLARVERSIEQDIYRPAKSDLFITASDQLTAHLCHEADIHITTASPVIMGPCASHWLSQNQRLLRSDQVPPTRTSWREIRTVEEATSGIEQ